MAKLEAKIFQTDAAYQMFVSNLYDEWRNRPEGEAVLADFDEWKVGKIAALTAHLAALEAERDEVIATVNLLPSVTGLSPVKEFSRVKLAIRDLQECYKDAASARNGLYTKAQARVTALEQLVREMATVLVTCLLMSMDDKIKELLARPEVASVLQKK